MRRAPFAVFWTMAVYGCVPWSSLYGSVCGNGKVEENEECDDGNTDDRDACLSSCRWARCGDGVVRRSVEECDGDDAGCSDSCVACSGDGTFLRADNGHCYTYHADTRSIAVAGTTCAAESASVVTFPEYHDVDKVYDGLLASRPGAIWLGMRRDRSGFFVWNTTGEPPVRFGPMLASSMTPDDCVIQSIPAGAADASSAIWTAVSCSGTIYSYVCEKSPVTIRPIDHHAYRIFYDPLAWQDAADACTAVGGHLATLGDAGENDFVSLLNQVDLWIGAHDLAGDGRFVWVTGEPLSYSNFSAQSGDKDATTDCLLLGASDHKWYARHCREKTAFVCEFD